MLTHTKKLCCLFSHLIHNSQNNMSPSHNHLTFTEKSDQICCNRLVRTNQLRLTISLHAKSKNLTVLGVTWLDTLLLNLTSILSCAEGCKELKGRADRGFTVEENVCIRISQCRQGIRCKRISTCFFFNRACRISSLWFFMGLLSMHLPQGTSITVCLSNPVPLRF